MRVLIRDTVSDTGTLDAIGDTRWYRSLTLEPLGGTHLVFPNSVSGYDQRHTHPIEVTYAPGGLVLVERLSPEEYLLGLGEMPYSWHPAALRAQAVAARTYLANLLAKPAWGVMAEFGFDICGSATCQVYLGAGPGPGGRGRFPLGGGGVGHRRQDPPLRRHPGPDGVPLDGRSDHPLQPGRVGRGGAPLPAGGGGAGPGHRPLPPGPTT